MITSCAVIACTQLKHDVQQHQCTTPACQQALPTTVPVLAPPLKQPFWLDHSTSPRTLTMPRACTPFCTSSLLLK